MAQIASIILGGLLAQSKFDPDLQFLLFQNLLGADFVDDLRLALGEELEGFRAVGGDEGQ